MAINKPRVAAWLLAGVASLAFAEKTAAPGDDFLEYLGNMEDRDDNWSDFASDDKSPTAGDQTTSNRGSSSSSSSSTSSNSHDRKSNSATGRSKQ